MVGRGGRDLSYGYRIQILTVIRHSRIFNFVGPYYGALNWPDLNFKKQI